MRKPLANGKNSPPAPLPGDVSSEPLDELEKTRRDILLARLESLRLHPTSAVDGDSASPPGPPPAKATMQAESVSDSAMAISAVPTSASPQAGLPCEHAGVDCPVADLTSRHPNVESAMIEEIMTGIVQADIARHLQKG